MAKIAQGLLHGDLDLRRGTFTMTSNYLYDEVLPKLKHPVEKLILFLMERKTIGFHRDSAVVSVQDMVKFTGASRSTVKRARRQLIKRGYLLVLMPGTGLNTSRYALDFEPDRPRGDAAQDAASQKIIEAPVPSAGEPAETKRVQDESAYPPEESAQDAPEQVASDSAAQDAKKASEIKGGQDDPSFKDLKDLNTGSGLKKTDKDREKPKNESLAPDTERREPESQEKVVASVCSSLRSFGFKVERRDYAFVGWCYNCYGVEALKQKLRIMKLQLMRGVKLINPFGWLRAALARDYQYSRWDTDRIKVEQRAKRARENSERRRQDWDRQREQIEAEQNDPAAQDRIAQVQAAFWNTVGAEAV